MGSSSSKPVPVQAPAFDWSKAKVELPDVEQYTDQVESGFNSASASINAAMQETSRWKWMVNLLVVVLFVGFVSYISYYYIYPLIRTNPIITGGKDLSITSAMAGTKDVKQKVIDRVASNELHVQADSSLGLSESETLTVTYQYPGEAPGSVSVPYGKTLDIVPSKKTESSAPSSWWNSRNLMSTAKDAKEVSTVSVPDNGEEGAYGYQFWMNVSDWSYKFGKEKHVMSREDSTNTNIMNPVVTLHPTDNTLKVSVSIFPTSDSSKAEPAPAGHSGSTDDVFVCEVPNIPIQTWVAVGITVSTRNLDIYLNGNLVKSCFLTGIPKPVTGSVVLNKDGGFSGYMCSFYHYAKLLVPSDTQSFFRSGVPCSVPGTKTDYKVTFGVNDANGKVITNYKF